MKHSHPDQEDTDEAIAGLKPYWRRKQIFRYNTDILELDKKWIRLKENKFYPEGGGQLADQGYLELGDNKIKVVDVQEKEGETWLITEKSPTNLEVGIKVHVEIDQERRENLSLNHSSQHLISAAFWEELNYETTRAEIGMKESQVELDNTPSLDEVKQTLEVVESLISKHLPIESKYYTKFTDLNKLGIRGKVDDTQEIFRLVKIGEYDLNLCGGTHVSNTSAIENIYLHKLEGKKIRFYSGKLARKHNQQAVINLHGISREMGVNIGKAYKSVVEMKSKYESYIKRNRKLKKELTRYQLLSAKWEMVKEISYKLLFSEEMEKGQIMDAIGKLEDGQLVLVITPSNLLILCSNNEILTGKVMDGLIKIGVKGGGRGSMLMGKVTETKGFENKLLDILHSLD